MWGPVYSQQATSVMTGQKEQWQALMTPLDFSGKKDGSTSRTAALPASPAWATGSTTSTLPVVSLEDGLGRIY